MNPERGQLVQIRFNNGVFFDAIVEDWSDQKSIVKLTDSGEMVIIQKTLQDVLLVKIMNKAQEETLHPPKPHEPNVFVGKTGVHIPDFEPIVIHNEVEAEFEELKNQAVNPESLRRMSELRDEMNKLDRKQVFGSLNEFKPSGAREVSYGIPRNIQISSVAQYTDEEIASAGSEFDSELQDLFDEKH